MGKLDNTLIIYISGDNGGSAEGSPNGTPNEVMQFNGVELAGRRTDAVATTPGAPTGPTTTWPSAGPGPSTRPTGGPSRSPSHFGGTRQGMAISWPAQITDHGGIRNQFHHVIDIVPTILEATGIPAPVIGRRHRAEADRGREHGLHLRQGQRRRPRRRDKTQYFEMMGVQGLYHDGWMLSAIPDPPAVGAPRRSHHGPGQRATSSSSSTSRRTGRRTTTSPRPIRRSCRRCRS